MIERYLAYCAEAEAVNYEEATPEGCARALITPLTGIFHNTCVGPAWRHRISALLQDREALLSGQGVPALVRRCVRDVAVPKRLLDDRPPMALYSTVEGDGRLEAPHTKTRRSGWRRTARKGRTRRRPISGNAPADGHAGNGHAEQAGRAGEANGAPHEWAKVTARPQQRQKQKQKKQRSGAQRSRSSSSSSSSSRSRGAGWPAHDLLCDGCACGQRERRGQLLPAQAAIRKGKEENERVLQMEEEEADRLRAHGWPRWQQWLWRRWGCWW